MAFIGRNPIKECIVLMEILRWLLFKFWHLCFLFTSLFFSHTTLSAQSSYSLDLSSLRKLNPSFDLKSFGLSHRSNLSEVTKLGQLFLLKLNIPVSQSSSVNFSGGLLLEVGSHASQFVDHFRPKQIVFLRNAFLDWDVLEWFYIKAGAISQGRLNNPLLVGSTAFPSVIEGIRLVNNDKFKLSVEAQQSIPNNYVLVQRLGSFSEGTPRFFAGQIMMELSS